jgi:hypothetical protein
VSLAHGGQAGLVHRRIHMVFSRPCPPSPLPVLVYGALGALNCCSSLSPLLPHMVVLPSAASGRSQTTVAPRWRSRAHSSHKNMANSTVQGTHWIWRLQQEFHGSGQRFDGSSTPVEKHQMASYPSTFNCERHSPSRRTRCASPHLIYRPSMTRARPHHSMV